MVRPRREKAWIVDIAGVSKGRIVDRNNLSPEALRQSMLREVLNDSNLQRQLQYIHFRSVHIDVVYIMCIGM
jgi:hypothetical protein